MPDKCKVEFFLVKPCDNPEEEIIVIDWYFEKDGFDWVLVINGKRKQTLDEIIDKQITDLPDNIYEFALEMERDRKETVKRLLAELGVHKYGHNADI